MKRQSLSNKKALLALSLVTLGACNKKIGNYQEPNCNKYNHTDGTCEVCSYKFWMTSEGRCVQVSDMCKTWRPENGHCTSCFPSFSLKNGKCASGNEAPGSA